MSQEALAVDANVDRSYVSGIERGTFNPTVEILDRIAEAMAVDISEFLALPAAGTPTPLALRPGRRKG